ncbi:uncharacterized protein K460DRAFT_404685 [Cucurbitaria berberidis CBS 394.84]|uniref:Uncharacterized protein n=1 Tax=Cucurbitaria berberidis CBS 394.84 TaxID=1168544 RepID=A0A9P4GN22_9PLEO|nr:uncharacterized protein K460DRAFT_404685 [Cucurbitaria berberidis CBS 394.84]KAF1849463.1 hypothetical protein K460DRAFT_404685 [Cucurbitaria berberidis CBS 394.84]
MSNLCHHGAAGSDYAVHARSRWRNSNFDPNRPAISPSDTAKNLLGCIRSDIGKSFTPAKPQTSPTRAEKEACECRSTCQAAGRPKEVWAVPYRSVDPGEAGTFHVPFSCVVVPGPCATVAGCAANAQLAGPRRIILLPSR